MYSHGSERTEQPVCFVGYSASDFTGSARSGRDTCEKKPRPCALLLASQRYLPRSAVPSARVMVSPSSCCVSALCLTFPPASPYEAHERQARHPYEHGVNPCARMDRTATASTTATLRLLDIEGGGDAARLRHAHRAGTCATAPLPAPPRKRRSTGRRSRQRHTGP